VCHDCTSSGAVTSGDVARPSLPPRHRPDAVWPHRAPLSQRRPVIGGGGAGRVGSSTRSRAPRDNLEYEAHIQVLVRRVAGDINGSLSCFAILPQKDEKDDSTGVDMKKGDHHVTTMSLVFAKERYVILRMPLHSVATFGAPESVM
jgi:hypothetical protein